MSASMLPGGLVTHKAGTPLVADSTTASAPSWHVGFDACPALPRVGNQPHVHKHVFHTDLWPVARPWVPADSLGKVIHWELG